MIDAMKGTELSAAAQKQLSPSAEVQSWAVAILWHSAQQIKSRTVTLNISLNADSLQSKHVANGHLKAHQSEQN